MTKKPYRVVNREIEEIDEEIRKHRIKILKIASMILILAVIVAGCLYFVSETKTYYNYQVVEQTQRKDSPGTKFLEFGENILKYSNDGALYINADNQLIWNQTYEMQAPMADVCQEYVAIADKKGKRVYIMDTQGPCGEIITPHPIQQVHVANQGMVAILMEENGTGYIHLYHKDGTFIGEGELHTKNTGYPLDIAISHDGKKMVVTKLDVNEGNVKSTVEFYNFGSVGQNEIDNVVSSFSYSDTLVLKVEFLTNDIAVAVGDNQLIFYEGSQRPDEKEKIAIDREIRSIFYNEHYIGLVFKNENKEEPFCAEIYSQQGAKVRSFDFSTEYEEIEFLQNDDICIRNNLECSIYTLRGIQRFHYNFDKNIYKVIHIGGRQYIFLMSETTEKVKLK